MNQSNNLSPRTPAVLRLLIVLPMLRQLVNRVVVSLTLFIAPSEVNYRDRLPFSFVTPSARCLLGSIPFTGDLPSVPMWWHSTVLPTLSVPSTPESVCHSPPTWNNTPITLFFFCFFVYILERSLVMSC
jgi:hypothetical protein